MTFISRKDRKVDAIFISTGMQYKECEVIEPCSAPVGLVMWDYIFVHNIAYANNTLGNTIFSAFTS